MKRNSKSRNKNSELYVCFSFMEKYTSAPYDDYRYWGLFRNKKGRLMVDPKRFQKMTGRNFGEEQLRVINNRRTHYFYPKKIRYENYNIAYFHNTIEEIEEEWKGTYYPLIEREVERIKKEGYDLTVADDYHFMCGFSSYAAAEARTRYYNMLRESEYQQKKAYLLHSLYAQFFHQMMSKTEAVFVKVLSKNNAIGDKFNRNVLYATANGCNKRVDELDSFKLFDKAYCIWNFLKHNSASTYNTLKERYSDVLIDAKYEQGAMAFLYVKFDKELIQDIIDGLHNFFEEYCKLVYKGETYEESLWNHEAYFERIADEEIEAHTNDEGYDMFDDID